MSDRWQFTTRLRSLTTREIGFFGGPETRFAFWIYLSWGREAPRRTTADSMLIFSSEDLTQQELHKPVTKMENGVRCKTNSDWCTRLVRHISIGYILQRILTREVKQRVN